MKDRVRRVLVKTFPNTIIPQEIDGLQYGSFDEWDSLGNFALLMLIEEEFGVEFSMRELTEIRTVTEILLKVNEI